MVGANGAVEFGVDADEDPELALALRVSLEEQRQRQRQEAGQEAAADQDGGREDAKMDAEPTATAESSAAASAPQAEASANADAAVNLAAMTEEEQLAWALQMSMAESTGGQEQNAAVAGERSFLFARVQPQRGLFQANNRRQPPISRLPSQWRRKRASAS